MTSDPSDVRRPLCFSTLSYLVATARRLVDPDLQRAEAASLRAKADAAGEAHERARWIAAAERCERRAARAGTDAALPEIRAWVEAEAGPDYWPEVSRCLATPLPPS